MLVVRGSLEDLLDGLLFHQTVRIHTSIKIKVISNAINAGATQCSCSSIVKATADEYVANNSADEGVPFQGSAPSLKHLSVRRERAEAPIF